ncbi:MULTISPECIES: sortase-dependent protein [Kitasatospora]|uniref:Lipoprotein n=1 Tax=Kitasatospora cystarginea TaxID=58350 RepID=A0ABN3ECD2_9ACTN
MNVPRTAAAAALLTAVLATATGCGIRPTAVPVDAGAPASRTACPNPYTVPTAVLAPTPSTAPRPSAAAGSPSAAPSGTPSSAPSGVPSTGTPGATASGSPGADATAKGPVSVFSAVPSPGASRCP